MSEVHDQLVGSLDTGVTVEALAKKYGISPISLNKYFSIMYGDSEELNGPNIIAKPLNIDDYMEIGYILPGNLHPSQLTLSYIEILKGLV